MRTYLQLLRTAFWMLPAQRWCTVVGLVCMVVLRTRLLDSMSVLGNVLVDFMQFGMLALFLPPAFLGGALWRALSAPRRIALAPGGRLRLLCAAICVAATAALWLLAWQALFDLNLPPRYRTGLIGYRVLFVAGFANATWWIAASFIASRSPLAMLMVVVVAVGGFFALDKLGVGSPAAIWNHKWGITAPLLLWTAFGSWYLLARRIAPPGWLLPGGQSILASAATGAPSIGPLSRHAALERLLLGGTSVPRILVQWLFAGGLLLFLLMLMARQGEGEALIVAHIAFAALIACPAIVAVQSMAIAQRARALWLPSGYSRGELFAFTERTLLKFALGMSLVFAAFLLLLWFTQPWHPTLTLMEALLVIVLPSLQLATHALAGSRGWDFYWRWPLVMLLCWFIAWKPLTSSDPVSWVGPRGWLWFLLAGVAIVSFHAMARRRWLTDDLQRAPASPAMPS